MAPMKKVSVKSMSKGGIANELATGCELKKSVASKVLDVLATVASREVKKIGKFTIPGLCMLKLRTKPATKAGKKEIFGKVVMVKAKPARKANHVSTLANGLVFAQVVTRTLQKALDRQRFSHNR